MKTVLTITVAIALSFAAFGSGFKCESSNGLSVKMFNNIDPASGTRTPAILVVSSDADGTFLVRKGAEIRKHNRVNTVQYVVEGSKASGVETAILQIRFKEGREVLEAEAIADAQLVLITQAGDRVVESLECARYLKSE